MWRKILTIGSILAIASLVSGSWKWSGRDIDTLRDGLSTRFRREAQLTSDADKLLSSAEIGSLKRTVVTKQDSEIFGQIAATNYWTKQLQKNSEDNVRASDVEMPNIVERVQRAELSREEGRTQLTQLRDRLLTEGREHLKKMLTCRAQVRYALEISQLKSQMSKPTESCDVPEEALY